MAKTRRTKKEKLRSSLRQTSVSSPLQSASSQTYAYSLPSLKKSVSSPASLDHSHLSADLRKTLFITGTIIFAQIILFVLLQNR